MEKINSFLSGVFLPAVLLVLSVFLLIYLKGKPFRGFWKLLHRSGKGTAPDKKSSAYRALAMALAGTLGVGNITGVADALQKGGAGVLFWMWVSALGAMVVKYAEVLLAMRTRRSFRGEIAGGAMFYIQPKIVALLFSLLGILCAFSVGSGLQATAAGQAWSALFSFSPLPLCLFLSLLTAFCIFRKTALLFSLTARLVPLMSGVYILLCLSVILRNAAGLPVVLRSVFQSAFTPSCALRGGTVSAFTALRFGVIRGLLSNEAGCGTAPIAHARSDATDSSAQATLGVVEVAVDTLLLCSLTGFAVLLVPSDIPSPFGAVSFALSSVFGKAANGALFLALFFFAFATLLCWSFYLEAFVRFLSAKKAAVLISKALFCIVCGLAPLIPEEVLWQIADFSVGAMTLLNLVFLFRNRKILSKEYS